METNETDFQGWPIKHYTWKELKQELNRMAGIGVGNDQSDFDEYQVVIAEDDGMGYGAVEGPCNGVEVDDEKKTIKLWF